MRRNYKIKKLYKVRKRVDYADGDVEWFTVYSTESPEEARVEITIRRTNYPATNYKLFMITEEEVDF